MHIRNKIGYGSPYQAYLTFVKPLHKEIETWSKFLLTQIAIYRKVNRKVYIIALSRKMPRFFDWLEKEMHNIPGVSDLFEEMKRSDVEVITEYAMPLIIDRCQINGSKPPVGIIADDAIIFGATANKIAMQWFALSGEIPILTALFRSDRGIISKTLESEYSMGMSRTSFTTLADNMNEISKCIMSSSLPVDMEYPIIHIRKSYDEVKESISKSNISKRGEYPVSSSVGDIHNESFTVLLEDCDNGSHCHDFSKIRLFKRKDECCIEIISPISIRVDSLLDKDLFLDKDNPDDEYNKLWRHVYNKVLSINDSESIDNSNEDNVVALRVHANKARLLTLIIWAEYLISFSTYIRYKRSLSFEADDMYIDKADLRLILGETLAEYAVDRLNSIDYPCHLNVLKSTGVVFEEYYTNSPDLRQTYIRDIAKALSHDKTLRNNLDALFMVSHYSGNLLTKIPAYDLFGHHCFGESYDSLINHLKGYNDEKSGDNNEVMDKLVQMHQWIDMRIDESRISPKYEFVDGSDRCLYARRFFLCGTNRF